MNHNLQDFVILYKTKKLSADDSALLAMLDLHAGDIGAQFKYSLRETNPSFDFGSMTDAEIFGGFFHKAFRQTDVIEDNGADMVVWELLSEGDTQFWDVVNEYFKPEQSQLMKVSKYEPKFNYVIDMDDLPTEIGKLMYDSAIDNEYSMFDYSDGDFYYMINMATNNEVWFKDFLIALPMQYLNEETIAIYFYQ